MKDRLRLLSVDVARACGIGESANCCAFLLAGADGFVCAQRSSLADSIYLRVSDGLTTARRTPESNFPSCQVEGRA
jgi:hypothetical protein